LKLDKSLLYDPEDHELSRLHRGDSNEHNKLAVVYVRLGHGASITAHEERLIRFASLQGTVPPHVCQKVPDRYSYPGPSGLVIGLEDHPLGAFLDGLCNKDEEAAGIYVFPGRITDDATSTPDPGSSTQANHPTAELLAKPI
jgi:hypothetical protein